MIQNDTIAYRLLRFFVENPGRDNAKTVRELIDISNAASAHQRMTADLERREGVGIVYEEFQRPQDVTPQHCYYLPDSALPHAKDVLAKAIPNKKSTAAGGAPAGLASPLRTDVKREEIHAPTDPSSKPDGGVHPPAPLSALSSGPLMSMDDARRTLEDPTVAQERFTNTEVEALMDYLGTIPDEHGAVARPPRKASERIFARGTCGHEIEVEECEREIGSKLPYRIVSCPTCGKDIVLADTLVPTSQGRLW